MSGLACLKCRVLLVPVRNGVNVEEGRPLREGAKEGGDPAHWGPYKLWKADYSKCPKCGFQLIHGFGRHPIAEHFMLNYEDQKLKFPPIVRIDACSGHKP